MPLYPHTSIRMPRRPKTLRLGPPDKPPVARRPRAVVKPKPQGPKPSPKPKPKPKAAPGAPATPGDPYDKYPSYHQLGVDEAHHEAYVGQQVLPWLSTGLANLTGVNPAAPGYNPTIQQQYLANVQGQVGGALNAAAAATPQPFAATTPGASTAAPNAYQGRAMQEYAAQRGGAAIQGAQAQSFLNTMQPNIYAQAALRSIADYAAGLPGVYVQKRAEERGRIDEFVAKAAAAAEDARHNRVSEAISAQNAQTNAAFQFGRLGLDTSRLGQDAVESAADRQATNARNAADNQVSLANNAADNAQSGANAATRAASGGGSTTRDASGRLLNPSSSGFIGGWKKKPKKKPPNTSGTFTQAADGTWWIKGKSARASGQNVKIRDALDLGDDLRKRYKPGDDGGWEAQNAGNPVKAAEQVAYWVRVNKPSFIVSGRRVDMDKLDRVLSGVVGLGAVFKKAKGILVRGYITADGRWK